MNRMVTAAWHVVRFCGLTLQILWIDLLLIWNRVQWIWCSR